ncbi:unnamed protein product [Moneuplotes crassus]|uniref:Uncharacterized protein n=2 Tax=Euplotes crassus TaxID=5936 RepID=A0AAD1UG41_EUPCR|nr:unnamed protein product [Moneuplotes crassus]
MGAEKGHPCSWVCALALLMVLGVVKAYQFRNTGTLYATVDPKNEYYYEYDQIINKCYLSNGTVVASNKLDSGLRFTAVAVVPSAEYLLFAAGPGVLGETLASGVGIFRTNSSNFSEYSSLKMNFHDGSSELSPRYERITFFNTKSNSSLRADSYEFMMGGRTNYDNDASKDTFLLYSGVFHCKNTTISIQKFYKFDQGIPTVYNPSTISLDAYSESGLLAILEDPNDSSSAAALLKFRGDTGGNIYYEVDLLSFKRDFSQINWMKRYQNNFQAEAFVNENLYLLLTIDSKIYLQVMNITTGSVATKIHYTIGSSEVMYYPQIGISTRFNKLFVVHKVSQLAPTLTEIGDMRISIFSMTDLSLMTESFTFSKNATPYHMEISQINDKELVLIKGSLDDLTGEDMKFTLGVYPQTRTQDFGTCTTSSEMTLTVATDDTSSFTVVESSLSGLFTDIQISMRLNTSSITYTTAPSLVSTPDCSVVNIVEKEVVQNITTYRSQNYTLVTVSSTTLSSGGDVQYTMITPSSSLVNYTVGNGKVTFNISQEYDLDQKFQFEYYAKHNSSLFTLNNYTVSVSCREECEYCDNSENCTVCNTQNLGFCEHITKSDRILANIFSITMKIIATILIFRSALRLRIDHALWMVIGMIQLLRGMTLMNIKTGLLLRDFLNEYLGGFITQIDINILPKLLFKSTTTADRKYRLFGLESYMFIHYFFTTMIVLIIVMFMLTFALAILECMKESKTRIKLMIAVATYLSFNLWIRGFAHFNMTLILAAFLEIKNTIDNPISVLSICSKILIGVWLIIMIMIYFYMVKIFTKKNRTQTKYPLKILELYEPLRPKALGVILYNMIFIVKRIAIVISAVELDSHSGSTQVYFVLLIFFLSGIFSIFCIRFRSSVTSLIFYITEIVPFIGFLLLLWYENKSSFDPGMGFVQPESIIDKIIISFIFTSMLAILAAVAGEGYLKLYYLKKAKNLKALEAKNANQPIELNRPNNEVNFFMDSQWLSPSLE